MCEQQGLGTTRQMAIVVWNIKKKKIFYILFTGVGYYYDARAVRNAVQSSGVKNEHDKIWIISFTKK